MREVINLTGKEFGKLTVIKRVENNKQGHAQWLCKCSCGNERVATTSQLNAGQIKSCSRCAKGSKCKILQKGQRFGRLVVLKRDPVIYKVGAHWICKCDCGQVLSVLSGDLRRGNIKSCGCLHKDSRYLRKYLTKDIIGKRFGRLIAIKEIGTSKRVIECLCDCGNTKSVLLMNLVHGLVRSCGCLNKDPNKRTTYVKHDLIDF